MKPPRFLLSRFVLVPLALALGIAAWNVYVARHDHGHIEGSVQDSAGRPLAGATVVLFERAFTNEVPRTHTLTDANGHFRFEANRAYVIELQAHASAGAASPRRMVHLWFRAQDRALRKPLIVASPSPG